MAGTDNNNISNWYRSFSGSDTLVFIIFPDTVPICLGSLSTISYSIYREKKPLTLLGRVNVKTFTRGPRFVAGTMVMTLINKQWVREVINKAPWVGEYGSNFKADELPIFDLMIVCANEFGAAANMFIFGCEVADESQTISIEDLITENQFSFVARDIDPMGGISPEKGWWNAGNGKLTTVKDVVIDTGGVADTTLGSTSDTVPIVINGNEWTYSNTDTGSSVVDSSTGTIGNIQDNTPTITNYEPGTRELYYSTWKVLTGTDVSKAQQQLNLHGASPQVTVNGIYDEATKNAVSQFQKNHGLTVSGGVGVVTTWPYLLKSASECPTCSWTTSDPLLRLMSPNMAGSSVTEAQNALNQHSSSPTLIANGRFDATMKKSVEYFQAMHGLSVTGEIDTSTWYKLRVPRLDCQHHNIYPKDMAVTNQLGVRWKSYTTDGQVLFEGLVNKGETMTIVGEPSSTYYYAKRPGYNTNDLVKVKQSDFAVSNYSSTVGYPKTLRVTNKNGALYGFVSKTDWSPTWQMTFTTSSLPFGTSVNVVGEYGMYYIGTRVFDGETCYIKTLKSNLG